MVRRGTELGELLTPQAPVKRKKPHAKRRAKRKRLKEFPDRQLYAFIESALQHNEPVYVSIDPGASGAIGLLSGTDYTVIDIPMLRVPVTKQRKIPKKKRKTTNNKTYTIHTIRRDPDFDGIEHVFTLLRLVRMRVHIALEKIDQSIGRLGRITYGDVMINRAHAMWPLYLHTQHFASFVEYRPGVWKKHFGLTSDKSESRSLALQRFPLAPLSRVKDHDRAEALLLALYLKELKETHGEKEKEG